jgi:hypothetical protein
MHRSGTSALSKGLEVLGINLGGKLLAPGKYNPKGFWENPDVTYLNIEILNSINSGWDDLAQLEASGQEKLVSSPFFTRALDLVGGLFSDTDLMGIKDPRFSVLLPFWEKVFAEAHVETSFIVSYRNPMSVADSLAKRNRFSRARSLWLWAVYNTRMLSYLGQKPCVFIDYDDLMQNPEAELRRLAAFLQLVVDPDKMKVYASEFLDPELRHTRYTREDLQLEPACDPMILEIYDELKRRAAGGDISVECPAEWIRFLEAHKNLLQIPTTLEDRIKLLEKELLFIKSSRSWKWVVAFKAVRDTLLMKNSKK